MARLSLHTQFFPTNKVGREGGAELVCILTVISLSCSSSWDFSSISTFSGAPCSVFSASSSDLWPFFCWVAVHNNRGNVLDGKDRRNDLAAASLISLYYVLPLDQLTDIQEWL